MIDWRMRQIAETAISWLYDNGYLNEYLEDRDIDLTDTEKEYFGIEEGE